MTLNPVCENVETAQGVPLTVTGVAQVKIMKNADLLQTASEQFLGKKEHEIKSTVLQTLEGHLRAILGEFPIVDSCRAGNLLSDEVFRNRMERERAPASFLVHWIMSIKKGTFFSLLEAISLSYLGLLLTRPKTAQRTKILIFVQKKMAFDCNWV